MVTYDVPYLIQLSPLPLNCMTVSNWGLLTSNAKIVQVMTIKLCSVDNGPLHPFCILYQSSEQSLPQLLPSLPSSSISVFFPSVYVVIVENWLTEAYIQVVL